MNRKQLSFAALGIIAAAGMANGQVYNEVPDAGDGFAAPAQNTGAGMLTAINGEMDWFNLGDHVDAFRIKVIDAANFMASTDPNRGGSFLDFTGFEDDSRLLLFDTAGNLVMANDDDGTATGSGSLESTLLQPAAYTADGGTTLNSPGSVANGQEYILAVTYFDNELIDAAAAEVVDFSGDFGALQGPIPGTGAPVGYDNVGDFDDGWTYTIALRGAMAVPAPASVALLGLGGLAATRRRR